MKRPFLWLVVVLVVAEGAAFLWQNRDVVALNRSTDYLVADAAFPETARRVLQRPKVTRRVLERIVEVAARREDASLQLVALERIASAAPADRDVQLRYADALRASGRLDVAEGIYRAQLRQSSEGKP